MTRTTECRTTNLVRFWGRDHNRAAESLRKAGLHVRHDTDTAYVCWVTNKQVEAVKRFFKRINQANFCVLTSWYFGEDAFTRCVAKMKFAYKGKLYDFEYDFGYGYPDHGAEFMFTDGNYGCDCNRSIFLSERFEKVEELDCGHEIELMEFTTERVP